MYPNVRRDTLFAFITIKFTTLTYASTLKAPPYEVCSLRHTPYECPKERYSVS